MGLYNRGELIEVLSWVHISVENLLRFYSRST